MESDSDSDGSHISATPPRPKPTLISRPRSSQSNSKAKKLFSEPPAPARPDPSPLLSSDLPFQILRRSPGQTLAIPTVDSFVTPGYFSKSAPSFSKNRRVSIDFDPDTYDPPSTFSPPNSKPQPEAGISGSNYSAADWVPPQPEPKVEVANRSGVSSKIVKKNVNLIRGNAPLPPVKLKGGAEGNFVKLNLNGRKRKFLNKGRRGSFSSSSRRKFYRKGKRKLTAQDGNEGDEDGLVTEAIAEQQIRSQEDSKRAKKFDLEAFEEAVAAARSEPSDENLVKLLRLTYGYDSFRDGQLEAIKMVLAGDSTMVVLPTGAGKSLCYQLSAVILPGVTLVVSPLIALMIDQLKQLPHMIRGGLLCSSQTLEEVSGTIRLVQEGGIKVLFVSPERFLNGEFLSIFSATPISLVVVDEAHCVSEWSHNFRPSYMRLRASMLRAKLNVNCILAMTATATATTLSSVMSALEIPPNNLIQKANLRDNLKLSVSSSGNRMKDLLKLIKSTSFKDVQSIIIYCKFQFETEMISRYLCDNNINAKSYHSGIPSKDRTHVQELFFTNKIRVVVATVAFGMGLDKRDIGSVIHYTLPESLEEYVQEIGRAGRDGRLSYCHLYFDDNTYYKLRSLMYSDGVDEYVVNKFLCQVFTSDENLKGKIYSLVKETASRKFDMKEEVMLTILTQLELGEVQYLHLLPEINVTCILNFHKTSPVLLAEKDVLIAAILKKSETKHGQCVFDIPTIANSIGVTTTILTNHLQNLKLKGEVTYEVKDQAYCYTIVEVPADLCSLSAQLTKWLSEVESCKVRKLDAMFNAAVSAVNNCEKMEGCSDAQQTLCLQRKILEYFSEDNVDVPNKMGKSSPFLQADIKVFLRSNSQAKFTPRAVARIMHGIPSPAYASAFWSKTHFWGRYTHIDFQVVMEAAKAELINFVRKDAV
ncbi:putative DNA helicase [Rosa chinensis]|uniref:DNA 3'-5' helicase n=1 Tax=Rosa chinensis TaxID=74649 RepID=A0A2P6R0L6_ROSCH|nr:ATP-dependent DNA helicase Q-like 5 [Rosa chinensis]XP_040373789.1 ATP-dependent DNA helicase Q-like 5 [Rosa chinensis]XP_040373790.1 ATP-dependent DNA helicase Q-like 5 [Rosa chinensis]XP_040373791.1 ATP-dependent DNA helicase Q-like 5 [Rosa chinensis]XP_040373792.1 ATP-dependent DNA helicase Q-like 5 [Rosa chinensis]PRQ39982.1 putative DNA helicase [Rosa chinensis]